MRLRPELLLLLLLTHAYVSTTNNAHFYEGAPCDQKVLNKKHKMYAQKTLVDNHILKFIASTFGKTNVINKICFSTVLPSLTFIFGNNSELDLSFLRNLLNL